MKATDYLRFSKTDEYPNGTISVTKEDAIELKNLGWSVDFHTDYYLNFLGVTYNGIEFGFRAWMDHLKVIINNRYAEHYEEIFIDNEEELKYFIETIDNLVKFKALYGASGR